MNSRRQRGEGKAGVIFWLLVFLVAGIFGKEWIPAKINDMQLKDHMEELAKRYPREKSNFFEEMVMRRAKELGLALEAKGVQVDKNARRVRFKVEYKEPLDLIFTTIEWEFRHDIERDIFII